MFMDYLIWQPFSLEAHSLPNNGIPCLFVCLEIKHSCELHFLSILLKSPSGIWIQDCVYEVDTQEQCVWNRCVFAFPRSHCIAFKAFGVKELISVISFFF